jgi:hypothetical protein
MGFPVANVWPVMPTNLVAIWFQSLSTARIVVGSA